MIFIGYTENEKCTEKIAVYVGQDTINEANDGKIVIVCGPFELTTPSYDEELGLTIDSIRTSRSQTGNEAEQNNRKRQKENAETLTEEREKTQRCS